MSSAHDPRNPAAHSLAPEQWPTGKLKQLRIDGSGVSMNWKVAMTILTVFMGSGAAWTTLGLAKLEDINAHNEGSDAHPVAVASDEGGYELRPMQQVVQENHNAVTDMKKMRERIEDNTEVISEVRDSVYDDRAERLADRAAESVRGKRRSREVWKQVRAKALDNLKKGKPIREGLQDRL